MTYAKESNIEAILGYSIDDTGTSRPSSTQLSEMILQADSIINAEARVATNKDDASGRLKVIAVSLVLKMITNMFALSNPDTYGFIEIELNDDQKRIIHMEHSVWQSKTWDIGN